MIFGRRLLAVLLGVVFVFVACVSSFVFRVDDTFLEPDYYIQELRKGDVYNFLYDEAMPAGLADIDSEAQDLPLDVSLLTNDLVPAARSAIPPQWIQDRVEDSINSALPYLTGDEDTFRIQVPLKDRVIAAGDAFNNAVREGTVLDILHDDVFTPKVDESLGDLNDLPFGVSITNTDVRNAVDDIAQREWLEEQVTGAVDQIVPYVAGDTERFTLRIDFPSRAAPTRDVLRDILGRADIRTFLFSDMIDPEIQRSVGPAVELPYGIKITDDEVTQAVHEALPQTWVDQRTDDTIDQTVDYLTDDGQRLDVSIPLDQRKEVALDTLAALAQRKLEAEYALLPQCTLEQEARLDPAGIVNTGIPCRPTGPGISGLDQLQSLAGVNIRDQARLVLDQSIPDRWRFTERDLMDQLDPDQWDLLQQVREWFTRGYIYTSEDLRMDLARADFPGTDDAWRRLGITGRLEQVEESQNVADLEKVRGWVRDGFTYNEVDLENRLREEDDQAFESFENLRSFVGGVRDLRWVAWLLFALLLIGVGLLGGRSVAGKLGWAAAFIALAGLVLLLFAGPFYNAAPKDSLRDEISQSIADSEGVEALLLDKVLEVSISGSDQFFSGIQSRGVSFLVIGGVIMALAIFWPMFRRRRPSRQSAAGLPRDPPPPGPTAPQSFPPRSRHLVRRSVINTGTTSGGAR